MHKRQCMWLTAGLCAVVLVFAGVYSPATMNAQTSAGAAALVPLQGMVQWQASNTEDWVTLQEPQIVAAGDMVRTGSQGLAALKFFEGIQVDILPNSVLIIDNLVLEQVESSGPFAISLGVLAGDTLHRVNQAPDTESRYEIYTPSAMIAVQRTQFWVSAYPMGETIVRAVEGMVQVSTIDPEGRSRNAVTLEPGESILAIDSALGEVLPLTDLPLFPPDLPLAPVTCGNGICEEAEADTGTCPADCLSYSNCGDGICDWIEGENTTVCPSDCGMHTGIPVIDVPPLAIPAEIIEIETPRLHFLWATMSCEFEPADTFSGSLLMHWGVGCFDSFAHASAHPHPADYQLLVDGELADMSTLRQSGPHLHPPYCPVGWSFELGPMAFEPGTHTLRLIETVTDTWSTLNGGGRNAGEVVEMTCTITVR
jgi:hypothetical protein